VVGKGALFQKWEIEADKSKKERTRENMFFLVE
jgi:hypothetical protein